MKQKYQANTITAHGNTRVNSQIDAQVGRRDFIEWLGLGSLAVAGGAMLWPFIDSMNPGKDVLSQASTEVNLSGIIEGQAVTVLWRGKPVFIRHRTAEEITRAGKDDKADLLDPASDASRVKQAQWLVIVGICTHLGCVPLGQAPSDPKGDYQGWFCPCHGSQYDISGRVRRGPAPHNLAVPPYNFVSDQLIRIG